MSVGQPRTARKFAAVQNRKYGGPSAKVVRWVLLIALLGLCGVFVFIFMRMYETSKRAEVQARAPAGGQWSIVKEEQVAILKAEAARPHVRGAEEPDEMGRRHAMARALATYTVPPSPVYVDSLPNDGEKAPPVRTVYHAKPVKDEDEYHHNDAGHNHDEFVGDVGHGAEAAGDHAKDAGAGLLPDVPKAISGVFDGEKEGAVAPAPPAAAPFLRGAAAAAAQEGAGALAAAESAPEVEITTIPRRPRVIVLDTGSGKINTGVWPNWGPSEVTLNWAAAGVRVSKTCPTPCVITSDQSKAEEADAVIVELVNYPKFGFPDPETVAWPKRRGMNGKLLLPGARPTQIPPRVPLVGAFYFEAEAQYPKFSISDPNVAKNIDFSMTPSMESTLPVSLICPWGRRTQDFLKMPAPTDKKPGRLIAYFNEHGVVARNREFVDEFFQAAGATQLHAYQSRKNKDLPPEAAIEPYQLTNRLDFLGTYKFALVTEAIFEADFIDPEYSHAILAGAVPVRTPAAALRLAAWAAGPPHRALP